MSQIGHKRSGGSFDQSSNTLPRGYTEVNMFTKNKTFHLVVRAYDGDLHASLVKLLKVSPLYMSSSSAFCCLC